MRKILSFLLMALFSVGMWAATETTVYYAVPSSVVGSYTVKLNTNQQTNPDAWYTYTMTKTELKYEGNPIYSVTFTDLWDGVAAMQIQLYDGSTWISQEQPISSWAGVAAYNGKMWIHGGSNWVELSGEEPDPTVGIKGAWDAWATTPLMELSKDKKTASIVKTMTEGTYEFGLELNSSWTANGSVFTRDANSKAVTGSGSNMKLTIDADGEYTFTWTFETNTLTVTYPDVVVIPAKFYVTGDSALVVDAGFDKSKAWSPSAIKVTENTYVLSGMKAGQEYSLKATLDGTWGTAKGYSDLTAKAQGIKTDGDNNIIFKMAKAGDVTVTLTDKVFTVEGDFAMPTVALAGTMNKWSHAVMEVAADKLSASIKVNLEVGVDSFKIVKDGIWLSLNGEGETNYRVKRDWPKASHINLENSGRNFVIDVDKAGEYTFKWTYSNDSLFVIFPTLESFDVTVAAPENGTITVKNGTEAIGAKVQEGTVLSVTAAPKDATAYEIIDLRAYKTGEPATTVAITDGKLTMPAFPITITAEEKKIEYQTIYFVNKDGWETVKAYVYIDDDHKYKVWPGEAMTKTEEKAKGKDVYSYRFPAKYTKIIFNDGDTKQTENHTWNALKPYICNGLDYAKAEDVVLDATAKYYVVGNAEAMGAWDPTAVPSAAEEYVIANLPAGDYQFRLSLDGTWANTKGFSDLKTPVAAGLKAGNDNNICFTLKEASDVTITYNETTFTVTGNFYYRVPVLKDLMFVPGVWAEGDAKIAAWIWTKKTGHEMEDQWTAFFTPKAEKNDTLTVKLDSEADSIVFVRFNKTAVAPSWEDKEDFRWNSLAGDTIDKIDLTYTIIGWNEGTWDPYIPAKYYLTGDSALVVDAGLNKEKAWNADAIKATEDSYVIKGLKAGQHYSLKLVDGETWKGYNELSSKALGLRTDGDNNIIMVLDKAGDVTVTYTDKVFTVEGDFAMPTVAIAGNVTGWKPVAMNLATDKLSASVTLENLAYGVDSFKIVLDGNWISANGEGESCYTFHRGWNQGANIKGGDRNMVIDRDNAGDYTFTWVYANDSLHIAFPAAPDTATIYFVNTNKDWTGKIYAHAFVGEKPYKEWPGVEMSDTKKTVWEKSIYSAEVPVTYNEIIFNNGEAQTATYSWTKAKPYFCDGQWYADQASIPEIEPAKYYITGNAQLVAYAGLAEESAWNAKAIKVTKDTFVFENLAAGYYLMKVVTKDAEPQWIGYDQLTEKSKGLKDAEDHQIGFTMEKPGNVMVVYKDKAFVVKGDYAKLPKVGLGANFNEWKWLDNLFEPAKDSLTASIKVNLGVTDTIRLKIVSDGNWLSLNGAEDTEYQIHRAWPKAEHVNIINDGRNFALTTDKAGDYTFTWTYADSTLAITFPALEAFAVTLTAPENGTITVKKGEEAIAETVQEGTVLTVTAAPKDPAEYEIISVSAYKTGDPTTVVEIKDGELTMPAFPITITAEEKKIVYQTLYFVDKEGWKGVNAYVFIDDDHKYKVWPGEAMKKEENKVKEKDLYSYTFPAKYTTIIFNKKDETTTQTKDMLWSAATPYYCNGFWYASEEAVVLDGTAKYYITGDAAVMGSWAPDAIKVASDSYTFPNLAVGTYRMKITLDGTWDKGKVKGYSDLTIKDPGFTTNGDNDIIFKLNEPSDVTVTYNATTFTVAGNFAQKEYYIAGTFTDWKKEMVKMTKKDDKYAATIEIKATEVQEFKVVYVFGADSVWYGLENPATMTSADGEWEIGGGEANIGLQPTKAGNYTFTFNPEVPSLTVEMPAQGGGTALENIEASEKAVKVMMDGQLIILKDGKMYNVMGALIR